MQAIRPESEFKEPLLRWFVVNFGRLAVYLLVAAVLSAIVLVRIDPTFAGDPRSVIDLAVVVFLYGGLFALPGAVIWLWILSRLSPALSVRRRRLIAALTALPLIGIVWIWEGFWSPGLWLVGLIYGMLLPVGSAWVIRLRERTSSAHRNT